MEKTLDFGTGGPPGDTVSWKGIVENDTLRAGDTSKYSVEITRPAADGPLPAASALTVTVVKLAPATLTIAPGPVVAIDAGNTLNAGETKSVDFHITNAPAGATPAGYFLVSIIQWGANAPVIGVMFPD